MFRVKKSLKVKIRMVGPPPENTFPEAVFYYKSKEVSVMWEEATRVATVGFSGVFLTLIVLSISIKIMSFFCKLIDKKGGKK